jgi:hypothetical protein
MFVRLILCVIFVSAGNNVADIVILGVFLLMKDPAADATDAPQP